MDYGRLNLIWAETMVDALVRSGVYHAVISPGSRSTPLTLASARHHELRTWVQQDERSAGFFALGLAKQLRTPAVLIATSGTAPANWYPAVIEASQEGHPIILLSADRPTELQDCGANQTIDQLRLFGVHARAFFSMPEAHVTKLQAASDIAARAVDRSLWPFPGPVHLNAAFREPLLASTDSTNGVYTRATKVPKVRFPSLVPMAQDLDALSQRLSSGVGLMVCGRANYGAEFAPLVTHLATQLRCPVLADPLSNLRFGRHDRSNVICHYDAFLRQKGFRAAHAPDWVLRFGATPISKVLQEYLAQVRDPETILINPQGPWPDPEHRCSEVCHFDPLELIKGLMKRKLKPGRKRWVEAFLVQDKRAERLLAHMSQRPLEAEILDNLIRRCPQRATLFCGNSMIVRDVDSFVGGGEKQLQLVANRGASGIDGNVSTALGMAAVSRVSLIALLGDLALYHDMNGLLSARELDTVLVVFNNGGGGIFGLMPQAELPEFERYWLTPTGLDIARIARLYGLRHHRVADKSEFESAIDAALRQPGADLIEIMIYREQSVARRKAYWKSIVTTG